MVTWNVNGYIVFIALLKSCVAYRLKCSVEDAVVSVQVQLPSKLFQDRSSYTFRTTNQHTFAVSNYTDCSYLANDTVNCSVWRGENAFDIVYKYYNSPYLLQLVNAQDGSVLWNDNITLNNLM